MEESKTSTDTFYPSYCDIQSDWELSLPSNTNNNKLNNDEDRNTFWISLIKHNNDEHNRCYIEGKVMINSDDNKNEQLTSNLIINKTNDKKIIQNLDWKMKLCPFRLNDNQNDNYYYYGKINCVDGDNAMLKDYKIIPFYKTENKIASSSINCIDIDKSNYFKRWYICAGLENGNINIIDVESFKLKMKCNKGDDNISSITTAKFFPFGDLILAGDTKGVLAIYAIADPKGRPAVIFNNGHKADISCINFINEGSEILSAGNDSTIILWNCGTQKQIIKYGKLGLSKINQIDLMQNNKILISSSTNGYLTFYDVKNGQKINEINVWNGENVECFSTFNHNDNCLITTNENGMCFIYDIRKINELNYIGKIQRNGKLIKKMIKCDNENELILYNSFGSIWKWNIDLHKDINNINNINTICEWTGNDQFGINDTVIMNTEKDKNKKKIFVATKNYEIKQYPLL